MLVSLLLSISAACGAETSIGYNQPFYIDKNLGGGGVGGYGLHIEHARGNWFIAYDRLQSIKRADVGEVNSQDFITAGYRHTFKSNVHLNAGIAVNERSDVLGSFASFNVGIGYEFGRYRVTWRHWSNANTNNVNHGFDVLTISRKAKR